MAAPYPLVVATGILIDQAAFPGIPGLLIQIRAFSNQLAYGNGIASGAWVGMPLAIRGPGNR